MHKLLLISFKQVVLKMPYYYVYLKNSTLGCNKKYLKYDTEFCIILRFLFILTDKPVEIRKPLSKLLKMRMKDPESNINKFNIVDYDIKSLGVPRGPAKWQPLKFPEKLFESVGSCESADEISPGE